MALDDEDIEIISAHIQDSVVKTADLEWRPKEKRFIIAMNRFAWEEKFKAKGPAKQNNERRRSVLRFDRVEAVRIKGINREKPQEIHSLLTIQFMSKTPPKGVITLLFSGDVALQLDVECIEVQLTDLGASWQAQSCPKHK